MNGIYVDFFTINRRKNALLSKKTEVNKPRKYIVENAIRTKSKTSDYSLCEYAEQLYGNRSLCNECFGDFIDLLGCANVNEVSSYDINHIICESKDRILPYLEDIESSKFLIERSNLTRDQKDILIETCNKFIVSDKILRNYDSINKKFDINKECMRYINDESKLSSVVENCFNFFNEYNIEPYQVMNIMIEEMVYTLSKNNNNCSKLDVVKEIVKEFMLNESYYSEKDIDKFKKVIESNYCLDYNTKTAVSKMIYSDKPLDQFIMANEKTPELLINNINSIFNKGIDYLTYDNNLKKVLLLLWDCFKNDLFEEKDDLYIFNYIEEKLLYMCDNSSNLYLEDYIGELVKQIKEVVDKDLSIYLGSCSENSNKCRGYINRLNLLCNTLNDQSSIIYNKRNIENINRVKSDDLDPVPIEEFKLFKFHNLLGAAIRADKFIKDTVGKKVKEGNNKVKAVFKKTRETLFPENASIYSFIGLDGKADICVSQLEFSDETGIKDLMNYCCESINNDIAIQYPDSEAKAYYIINPGIAEVRIKDPTPVEMSLEMIDSINAAPKYDLDIYIENFAYTASVLEAFEDDIEAETIIDKMVSLDSDEEVFDKEVYNLAMEAASLTAIPSNIISVFSESQGYNTPVLEKYDYIPLDVQLEAYMILDALLEADLKKPKVGAAALKKKIGSVVNKKKDTVEVKPDKSKESDDKEDSKDGKIKNPFKGLNTNTLKLYLQGLKKKVKDMSQKEKELSRNLDNSFRRLVKASKDALISDRREAIIKGSVIPSFSKCIKIAIALAGEGLIFGNPVVPLLTFLGGLAMSKNLTKKERILLLDEIDTELEVVEKEIANAESKNQMKKYRALLKYKKDLQRQYQRIRYNVKVGKDILPDSTTGLKNND